MKIAFILLILFQWLPLVAGTIVIPLQGNWQFRQVGQTEWLEARVPGTVHTDLLTNKKIEDPFFGDHEKNLQWIEREDWEYKTTFIVGSDVITKDKILLVFHGLDTHADVFVNDSLVLQANNMFRSWNIDVAGLIRRGQNDLRIYFHAPLNKTEQTSDAHNNRPPFDSMDRSATNFSVFPRKAWYHFGTEWNPLFVTSGIWKPIELVAWDRAKMQSVFVRQISLDEQQARMRLDIDFDVTRPFTGEVSLLLDGKMIKNTAVDLRHGLVQSNISFTISNPEMWWPNGMGNQKLYKVEILLMHNGEPIDRFETRIGLRTLEFVRTEEKRGMNVYFKVNGHPVFIKGANYVPQDIFLPGVKNAQYEQLLQLAADVHMNMIRVRGDGIYESELFYDLCDEKGLLVWHDFMYLAAFSSEDSAFLENLRFEAQENVYRLRHHPAIALWFGNHEISRNKQLPDTNSNDAGNQFPMQQNSHDSAKRLKVYEQAFRQILPEAVKRFSHEVPYWESFDKDHVGDSKKVDLSGQVVWWGMESFENQAKSAGKYISPSFPAFGTVKTFAAEKDWDSNSTVLKAHQKSRDENGSISQRIQQNFGEPRDFEKFLYLSQLMHAEGAKIAMESDRINNPQKMGALLWQLNDCWPGASWSAIDYSGRPKALYYYARRAFSDALAVFDEDDQNMRVWVHSGRYEEVRGVVLIEALDMDGKVIYSDEKKIKLKSDGLEEVWKKSKKELLQKSRKQDVMLRARLYNDEAILSENTHLFVSPKELKLSEPNIKTELISKNGKLFLELKSSKTAFGVVIFAGDMPAWFSDNFFTLIARDTKTIEIRSDASANELKSKIAVQSLFESTKP